MVRRALGVAALVSVVVTASSPSVAPAAPTGPSAAAEAVVVLADPMRPGDELGIPSDFAAVMGYQPAIQPGPGGRSVAVRADGTCSSPLGGTAYGFDQACQAHDLGYDLLRYAGRTGEPLGTWARRALDASLGERMRQRCATEQTGLDLVGCLAIAELYEVMVGLNSWRQAFGVPGDEPPMALIGFVLAALTPPTLVARSWWRRRRGRSTR